MLQRRTRMDFRALGECRQDGYRMPRLGERKTMKPITLFALAAVLVLVGCNQIKQNVAVFNCGDAECSYEAKMFEEQQYGVQSTLDDFRECHDLFVQGESETQEHFIARIPETKGHLCLLYRKAVQSAPLEPGDRLGRRGDISFMGGNFD